MQNFVNFYLGKNQNSIYLPAGDGKVSFVDVRDIAAVAVQALTSNKNGLHTGKAYTITGSDAISYGDAAGILSDYIDRKVSYVNISEDDAGKAIINMGMSEWHTNIILEGLGITEFSLRYMTWKAINDDAKQYRNSQMAVIVGPKLT